jgi:asparagine synthase (glutamine-hydrolysing)
MKALYGVFTLDGAPAVDSFVRRTGGVLCGRQSEGRGEWCEGSVGLGQQSIAYNLEPNVHVPPVIGAGGEVVAVHSMRLDNRRELCERLRVTHQDATDEIDGALLIKAYEAWGEDCAAHLLGDWAFVLWDRRQRRMLLARDYIGSAPLYYYRDEHKLAFATSLPSLLRYPGIPRRLNPLAIAQLSAEGKRDAASCYESIHAVPPAHVLSVCERRTVSRRYWHPQDIRPIRFPRNSDYIEAFKEVYTEAVRCRLSETKPVGIMLSSGLDSASVAAVAAPALGRRNQTLSAYTCVPQVQEPHGVPANVCPNERGAVERICSFVGNIEPNYLPTVSGPLEGLRWATRAIGQPSYITAGAFWMRPALEAAQRCGIGVLLTGDWGNFSISWSGDRPVDGRQLLSPTHWPQLARDARRWRAQQNASIAETAERYLTLPLRRLIGTALSQQPASPRAVVRSQAARAVIQSRGVAVSDLEALRRVAPQPLQALYNLSQSGSAATLPELGAEYQLEVRTPPLDQRVVEFCFGLPVECYSRAGRTRLLIREAMEGLLPADLLWNDKRGLIAADMGHWVHREQDEIAHSLRRLQASALARHWLDLPAMTRAFRNLLARIDTQSLAQFGITLRGLAIGEFLLGFDSE